MPPSSSSESIKARGLVKAFGNTVAVDGLDFDAVPGRCLGILGPNGAGKTTTIEMLEGLIEPDRGVIVLFGLTWEHDAALIRERIGVQLQETLLPDKLRVFEALRVFRSLYRSGRTVEEVLALTPNALLLRRLHSGTDRASGGRYERAFLVLFVTGADGRLARAEWFDPEREAVKARRLEARKRKQAEAAIRREQSARARNR